MSNTHAKLAALDDLTEAVEAKLVWEKEMAAPLSKENGEDLDLAENRCAQISALAEAHRRRCCEIRDQITGMKLRIEWLKDRARTHHHQSEELHALDGRPYTYDDDYRVHRFQEALHSLDESAFTIHFGDENGVPF